MRHLRHRLPLTSLLVLLSVTAAARPAAAIPSFARNRAGRICRFDVLVYPYGSGYRAKLHIWHGCSS